jgi:hypothetical protein
MNNTIKYTPMTVPIYGNDSNNSADDTISALKETPTPDAQPYLEVVAPATLPEVSLWLVLLSVCHVSLFQWCDLFYLSNAHL